jgi:hypothetical protein
MLTKISQSQKENTAPVHLYEVPKIVKLWLPGARGRVSLEVSDQWT